MVVRACRLLLTGGEPIESRSLTFYLDTFAFCEESIQLGWRPKPAKVFRCDFGSQFTRPGLFSNDDLDRFLKIVPVPS